MYFHRGSTGPVDLAFTDRYDGVSAVPFDSLDLALGGADDPEARRRNVELLLEDFAPGAALADMEQVHGTRVVEAGRLTTADEREVAASLRTLLAARASALEL